MRTAWEQVLAGLKKLAATLETLPAQVEQCRVWKQWLLPWTKKAAAAAQLSDALGLLKHPWHSSPRDSWEFDTIESGRIRVSDIEWPKGRISDSATSSNSQKHCGVHFSVR